jgi:hypothetical protein
MAMALVAAMLVGCGDDKMDAESSGGRSVEPGFAGAAAAADDDAPSQVQLEIPVAGSDEPIRGSVSEHGGLIDVTSYPAKLTLPLRYGSLVLGYEDAFSDEFCESIENHVADVDAYEQLRLKGALVTEIPVSSFVWPETARSANSTAHDAGVSTGVNFANPFTIDSAELSLELTSDAISNTLGVDVVAANLKQELAKGMDSVQLLGSLRVTLGAKDLWCDFAQGNAILHINVVGKFGAEQYEGETLVTGVSPL